MVPLPTKTKVSNQYFTKVHEQAILDYASSTDKKLKSQLYKDLIQPSLNEMVEKIVYTYKFNALQNIEDLKDDCKAWLITILDKYDVNRGSKAFSYFSVITKNWFIYKTKKQNNRKEIGMEEVTQHLEEEYLSYETSYIEDREKKEFWNALWEEMDSWKAGVEKDNEHKVYNAIKILLRDHSNIEIFNKKALYYEIREITKLNTKQVVSNLKKFRIKYKAFKQRWDNGLI